MKNWVIYMWIDEDGEPLFWSNEDGAVALSTATVFSDDERNTLHLPEGGHCWMEMPSAPQSDSDGEYEALLPDGTRCEWDERLRITGAHRVRKQPAPLPWEDDSIQFSRLISEIVAAQTLDIDALCEAMDLTEQELDELFERARMNDYSGKSVCVTKPCGAREARNEHH